jgi:clan AA aspartic protease (TIGR02281 family)
LPRAFSPKLKPFTFTATAWGEEVKLVKDGGVYKLPVTINRAVTLKFIVDTGAAEVHLPIDVVLTLIRTETIERSDILDPATYRTADGSVTENMRVRVRSLQIGNRRLTNVSASIGPVESPLLLGQSALEKLEPWRLDTGRKVLVLEQAAGLPQERRTRWELQMGSSHQQIPGVVSGITAAQAREFLVNYLRVIDWRDSSRALEFYDDQVDHFGQGIVSKSDLEKEMVAYFRRWPTATNKIDGPVEATFQMMRRLPSWTSIPVFGFTAQSASRGSQERLATP